MNYAKNYLKIFLVFFALIFFGKINAQVGGFTITTPTAPSNFGSSFPVNIVFNWTAATTRATAVIEYNPAVVEYDQACTNLLPDCMQVIPGTNTITIDIQDLTQCVQTNSVGFAVCFKFKCPDSCFGQTKTAVFNGSLSDNFNSSLTSTTTASGILQNTASVTNSLLYFNQLTGELAYQACFYNSACFVLRQPSLTIEISSGLGTITSVSGTNFIYTLSGNTVTINSDSLAPGAGGCLKYIVKLPCNTGAGVNYRTRVNLLGKSCNVPNSVIKQSPERFYVIPAAASAAPNISLSQSVTSTYFYYVITNTGNTPLNLSDTNFLPAVHLTSVSQTTSQPTGLTGTIKYFDCSAIQTSFALNGTSSNSNVPANTTKFVQTVTNLMPGEYVTLQAFYTNSPSCNNVTGTPPFRDSVIIAYNCNAPANSCTVCGPGGIRNTIITYNTSPSFNCQLSNVINDCKNLNDTVNLCYRFSNTGTTALNGGLLNVVLPAGLQALPGVQYTGFTTNPTVVNGSNIQFNLPVIPNGSGPYTICLRAVVSVGAASGDNTFYTMISGTNLAQTYLCTSRVKICNYTATGITKRVKGSNNSSYSLSGEGAPNTLVNWELTLRNKGSVAIHDLVVIDRIPAINNREITGGSAVIPNQFNMQMVAVPANSNYTVEYTGTQNICTGWPGTGTPCNSGIWAAGLQNGGVRFTFPPAFTLAPGDTFVINYQTRIPAGTANNLSDCNTAGFMAVPVSGGLNAAESPSACIVANNPCNTNVTPAFTVTRTCNNYQNVFTAVATQQTDVTHEWSLMQTSQCGVTTDAVTVGGGMQVQTGSVATFTLNNSGYCYYIKHKITVTGGCYTAETRTPIVMPPGSNSQITLVDIRGEKKNEFCIGEEVFLDGSASVGGSEYSITIRRRPASGIGQWSNFVTLPVVQGQPGVINLTQLLLNLTPPRYFQTQYEYYILFTINNPANCTTSSTKTTFKIKCCDDFINPHFQLGVMPAAGSYTITAALFNLYAGANATHEWYVLSSPNQGGGPYTPEYSTTSNTFSWSGCQYGLYYTVIHKVKTSCGEVCKVVEQYQSQGRNQLRETDNCCLAFQFWPNGPSTNPQGIAGNFELGLSPAGSGHFTVTATPTYTYTNPNITHEWFVISSPAPSGPYTAAGYGTASSYSFSGVDGLYYFVTHKIKTPCGEVCFRQNISRNIKADKCDLCEPKECKPTETVWPKCYPPTNLRNDCRRENLRWDVVPGTASYQLELSYNDKECCDSKYPQMIKEFEVWDRPMLILSQYSHPKYECFRWRVRAKCDDGYSEWSQWLCYAPCPPVLQGPILIPRTDDGDEKNNFTDAENMPQVAPNPNNGDMFLQMKTKGELTVSVEVYNTQGVLLKKIAERKYPDGTFMERLSMGSGIPKGMYMVVFKTNKGNFSKKVIIQ